MVVDVELACLLPQPKISLSHSYCPELVNAYKTLPAGQR
jgi:hypothetical protein